MRINQFRVKAKCFFKSVDGFECMSGCAVRIREGKLDDCIIGFQSNRNLERTQGFFPLVQDHVTNPGVELSSEVFRVELYRCCILLQCLFVLA